MEILRNKPLNMTVRIFCLCGCLALIAIGLICYKANALGILTFLFFGLVYVQLPGQFLIRMLDFRPAHFSTVLSAGFFTGWAFVTLQYFLTELIHTDALLLAAGPICTIIYLILLVRDTKRTDGPILPVRFSRVSAAFCLFVLISFFYAMMETQFLYLDPSVDEATFMNPDKAFHMGLISSLSHGYPLECPWFSGLYYNYHIFTELLYSVPVRLFGLTVDTALMSCGPLMTVYAVGISFYSLFRELTKGNRAGLYCLILILSNIFIVRGIDNSLAFLFILRNENVAGYGVSCTLVLAILIRYWYDDWSGGRTSWKKLILVMALLMLATGIKGPFGLVMLAGLWGTYVLGLLMREVKFSTALPLILITLGFLLVYMTVLGSKGQGSSSLIVPATILNIAFYKAPLIAWMKGIGLPLILRYGVLLFVFSVFMLTAFFLPFVIGYIRELILVLTRRKDFDYPRIVIYAASLVGFMALMILNYNGHSQVYFGFVTVFFAPLIAFWFFEDMADNKGVWMKIVRVLFVLCLIFTACGLALHMTGMVQSAIKASDPHANAKKYQSMSRAEYEGMRWIDENTPKDSLLATDRYYSTSPAKYDVEDRWDNRFFLYADYANRICYLAGSGYNLPVSEWPKRLERIEINDRFYDAGDAGRGELARDLGIDYVVVSKRFTHPGNLENQDYNRCFSNEDIDIYEIRQ